MAKRNRYLHIRTVVWNTQEIGISDRNWNRLNSGYYAGIKVDQKLAGKTMYPGIFAIRVHAGINSSNHQYYQMWKGIKLHLFPIHELVKISPDKPERKEVNL